MRQAIFENNLIENQEDINWNFSSANTQEHIHSIHPYPARFIPQIPRLAIKKWSKENHTILDPFCGCGTTLVEAVHQNRKAIGIDNNGVAILISKAKVANYSSKDLNALISFLNVIPKLSEKNIDPIVPNHPKIDYWFDDKSVQELGIIKKSINKLEEPAKTFALAILSSIIVRISYQDSDTRYSRIKKPYKENEAFKIYQRNLKKGIESIREVLKYRNKNSEIYLGDSRNLSMIKSNSVDLIVTSPPYLNAYDYHKYHRHRLHWIDADIPLARDLEIGKHDVFTRPNAKPDKYFEDLSKCFKEWKRVLKPNSRALIVIGDAIVNKNPVPVGKVMAEIMEDVGFINESWWIRDLNKNRKSFNQGARIDKEHVVLFREDS